MNRMWIGICDDDAQWHKTAGKILERFLKKMHRKARIVDFYSKEEIFSSDSPPMDLLFLDLEFKEGTVGVEIAAMVNQKWPHCQIVFLSNYIYYATEVYDTEHIFYLLKENFEAKLGKVFKKALADQEKRQKKITLHASGKFISVYFNELCYLERKLRCTRVHAVWGSFQTREKLDELMETLPPEDFIRCHNSYIVNLEYVREINAEYLVMDDGSEISISRKYARETREAFLRWALARME